MQERERAPDATSFAGKPSEASIHLLLDGKTDGGWIRMVAELYWVAMQRNCDNTRSFRDFHAIYPIVLPPGTILA